MTRETHCLRSGTRRLDLISVIGRPTSVGMRFMTFSVAGVNLRIRRSLPSMIIGMLTLLSRLFRSLFTRDSSSFRVLQFFVDGGQFLVSRLKFLFRRFQFLIDALQFLIAGLDFLVCRPQLFIRRPLFFNNGLQIFARGIELLFEVRIFGFDFRSFGFGCFFVCRSVAALLWTEKFLERRAFFENDEVVPLLPRRVLYRKNLEIRPVSSAPSSSTSTPSLRTVPRALIV